MIIYFERNWPEDFKVSRARNYSRWVSRIYYRGMFLCGVNCALRGVPNRITWVTKGSQDFVLLHSWEIVHQTCPERLGINSEARDGLERKFSYCDPCKFTLQHLIAIFVTISSIFISFSDKFYYQTKKV